MKDIDYDFIRQTGRVLNSLESSTILLTGNVHDIFYAQKLKQYVPLLDFLKSNMKINDNLIVTYKISSTVKFQNIKERKSFSDAWEYWRYGEEPNEKFNLLLKKAGANITYALELLRQMCVCSNAVDENGNPVFEKKLLIIIEGIEAIIPAGAFSAMSDSERIRAQICIDWFKDPLFIENRDAVILISESKQRMNPSIVTLPHLIDLSVPFPNQDQRAHYVTWFNTQNNAHKIIFQGKKKELTENTAGLSTLALRRLLKNAAHKKGRINSDDVLREVKNFIERELGDVVEFKVPKHSLKDVVGCTKIKKYVQSKVIPRFKSTKNDCLPGATICGPIGSGKTFFWEAVAAESGMIVLVLSRLRDKWFGESDVRLERLKRLLYALVNVLIFIDEADAQFTSLSGNNQHATEKRLQAGILGMMSDPVLRGRVKWLLLTARIDRLSHDILRPGRPGSLVIPMLDPTGQDRKDFLLWSIKPVLKENPSDKVVNMLTDMTTGYFAAMFAELRSELLAEAQGKKLSVAAIKKIIADIKQPAVSQTRTHQALLAKAYCNRRSLLPDES
ncbi:MAG: AAA family ATPase [Candidatus Omnitrophica bacterium]|nr:AAA family ATPase [Candidatus Omnitrophota bacterium]